MTKPAAGSDQQAGGGVAPFGPVEARGQDDSGASNVDPEFCPPLCAADLDVLRLIADGLGLEAVARRLALSERTVRRRIRSICDQLGVRAPVQAVAWAARRGLI